MWPVVQVIFQSRSGLCFVACQITATPIGRSCSVTTTMARLAGRAYGSAKYLAPLMDSLNFVDNGALAGQIGLEGFSVDGDRWPESGRGGATSPSSRRRKLKRQVAAYNRGSMLDLDAEAVEFCMTTDHATPTPGFGASFYHSTRNYKRR